MPTNFLQFDPNMNNMESDSAYYSDLLRQHGSSPGDILPSIMDNKFMYQVSTMCYALATMMSNKGYAVNDAPASSLVTVLANLVTNADMPNSIVTVPYATSIAFPTNSALAFQLMLTGNVNNSALVSPQAGQFLVFIIQQDATGSRTFVWPPGFWGAGPICPTPLCWSVQSFKVSTDPSIILATAPMMWWTGQGTVIPPVNNVITQVTTSGNVAQNAFVTEEIFTAGGAVNRYLYPANGRPGWIVNMKKMDADQNPWYAVPMAGQTIDGFPNWGPIYQQYNSYTFQSDGSNWILI